MKPRPAAAVLLLLAVPLALLLTRPATATAENFRISSETLVHVFERDTTKGTDELVIPAYEYLRLDYGQLEEHGLSLHLYGWGRHEFADSAFYEDDTAGEFLYGYLQYTLAENNLDLRLGRQHIFAGIANESVDGLSVATDLCHFFSLSLYGGQPVALDSTDGRDGDSIYGGRLSLRRKAIHNIGISYKKSRNDSNTAEEFAGIDLALTLPADITLSGLSTRNLEAHEFGEHSYELNIPIDSLLLRPYVQSFEYEGYFGTGANSANPFRFLSGTKETLTLYGGDIIWQQDDRWDLALKVKSYDYDLRDGSSQFYALQGNHYFTGLRQCGAEVGYMDGDEPENQYLLARAFFYVDQLRTPLHFLTGDVVYVDYDQAIFGEDSSLFVSLGAGRSFLDDALKLKISGDYSSDPFFDEDIRGLLVAQYNFGK